jgi:hypothetical protein
MTGRGKVCDTDCPADHGRDAGDRDERRCPGPESAQPLYPAPLKRGRRPPRPELSVHRLVQQLPYPLLNVVHS